MWLRRCTGLGITTLPYLCHTVSQTKLVLQKKDAQIASRNKALTQAMGMRRDQEERLKHLQQVVEQREVANEESAVRQYPVTMQCV